MSNSETYDQKHFQKNDFGIDGDFALTWGGGNTSWSEGAVVDRPKYTGIVADKFERQFLKYCSESLGIDIRACAGTNSLYWAGKYLDSSFEFKIIGAGKNIASFESKEDWILRIEEEPPFLFCEEVKKLFNNDPFQRNVRFSDKTLFQFKAS
ncbi:MAG: hypothetical protein QX199_17480 [Methylococcaceae bacterium]